MKAIALLPIISILTLPASAPTAEEPAADLLGQKIPDLILTDLDGKEWSLHAQAGKKAIVIAMLSTGCPMANAYLPDIAELSRRPSGDGVLVVGINANPAETAAEVAAHAKEFRVPFPVLRDEKGRSVEALQARVNSEVFLLDGGFTLRYRGSVDDGYSARLKRKTTPARRSLELAIDAVLAGKEVSQSATPAFGCEIRPRQRAGTAAGAAVTFNRDVMPILQSRCQDCHRPGEVGPFPLLSFRDAVRWGEDIVEFTRSRKMPPWKPIGTDGLFEDERRMPEEEIRTLERWLEAGMPEGDAKDLPPPAKFTDGWRLGEPDLVLEPSEEMTIAATGKDLFRVMVLPTGLTEDRFVSAIEVRPGNRRVVHHTLQFYDTRGRAKEKEAQAREKEKGKQLADRGPGYNVAMGVGFNPDGGLGGWAPGNVMKPFPEGVGYRLPAGSDVVLQVHYHRTGKEEKDRPKLGIHFAKKPVTQRLRTIPLAGVFLAIPRGEERFPVKGVFEVQEPAKLLHLTPHMHLLGKEIEATLLRPDGTAQRLIAIRDWDYNWQETYRLREPIEAPAGSYLLLEAVFDNSEKNPLNPHRPPRAVRLGEETTDEMCFVFIGGTGKSGNSRIDFSRLLSEKPWKLLAEARKKNPESAPKPSEKKRAKL